MIVVTGLMRSGTTPIARMLHQGGVLMGTTQLMPVGQMDSEWEDYAIQKPLVDWMFGDNPTRTIGSRILQEYIDRRRRHTLGAAQWVQGVIGWGFKTPFVATQRGALARAAERMSEPLRWIVCQRPIGEAMKSLELRYRKTALETEWKALFDAAVAMQPIIEEALGDIKGLRIDIRDTWDNPAAVKSKIEGYLGIELGDRALDGIGRK